MKNRKLSKLGGLIASGAAANQTVVPVDEVLYLQSYGKLSKVGYTTLRHSLLPYGVILPTYDTLAQHKLENVVPNKLVSAIYNSYYWH